ncbi:hypothetical protein HPB50_004609 [Hyalomma asiaticum]|uniref:Uncharacterized protein n=1 Tax=Hyalomma asiaticum TaxID=266040 RepID=A0ACB7TEH9_HYAAI|nr:hypothetical protein HPB50_004609 [Hyalomma asiaticum]
MWGLVSLFCAGLGIVLFALTPIRPPPPCFGTAVRRRQPCALPTEEEEKSPKVWFPYTDLWFVAPPPPPLSFLTLRSPPDEGTRPDLPLSECTAVISLLGNLLHSSILGQVTLALQARQWGFPRGSFRAGYDLLGSCAGLAVLCAAESPAPHEDSRQFLKVRSHSDAHASSPSQTLRGRSRSGSNYAAEDGCRRGVGDYGSAGLVLRTRSEGGREQEDGVSLRKPRSSSVPELLYMHAPLGARAVSTVLAARTPGSVVRRGGGEERSDGFEVNRVGRAGPCVSDAVLEDASSTARLHPTAASPRGFRVNWRSAISALFE